MAAVAISSSFQPSSHVFVHHQHSHPLHGLAGSVARRNPFEAFYPRHSSFHSPSTAPSWRHSEPMGGVRVPAGTVSPQHQRGRRSHYRTPSSPESSNVSWRSHSSSPGITAMRPSVPDNRDLTVPLPIVYSAVELLRLSASPLVGISAESQLIVDDLVARHVWRRGQQSDSRKAGSRDYKRRTSKPRSHSSLDDSGHSD